MIIEILIHSALLIEKYRTYLYSSSLKIHYFSFIQVRQPLVVVP